MVVMTYMFIYRRLPQGKPTTCV